MNDPHDFDFLFGRWAVAHRRRIALGVGDDRWDEFRGTCFTEPRMGGVCNVEEHDWNERGWRGVALRTHDLATGDWSIRWISDADGLLSPAVTGRFDTHGRCRLEGRDVHCGRPIIVRFEWTRTDVASPRWTQDFSFDDGGTWERNWVMDFAREPA